jgi:DNA polymerase-3 subunit epsilon
VATQVAVWPSKRALPATAASRRSSRAVVTGTSRAAATALHETAQERGLHAAAVRRAHDSYFESVAAAAMADGVVTAVERSDLDAVAALLGISENAVDAVLRAPAPTSVPAQLPTTEHLSGLSMGFTGALVDSVGGTPITRAQAQAFAVEAGLIVKTNVSKGLDLLGVADPDSRSGKAVRARELGYWLNRCSGA